MSGSASILCVIDFSASSKKTLQWAISNARTHKSHLTVLYPYRLTRAQYGESAVAMRKKIEDDAKKNFGIMEQELLKDNWISYDFKTEVGFIADRVQNHTKNHPINFLVIDKNIRTGNKESFDDLVENTEVPLVIVP